MADNNTYTSKQNIKKYTTQAKFDAIDKSDVPVGTEYNIVGEIEEADLSSELQVKINSTTPVDQTYSATSENAQSGKAVAGALSSKQDKINNQTELTARSLTTTKDIICENNLKGRYLFCSHTNMGSPSNSSFLIFEYGQSGIVKSTMRFQTFSNFNKNIVVNFPNEDGTVVYTKNLKTIFGNQSIVGSGNIDLYNHFITIDARSDGTNGKRLRAFVKKTSSNNLKVDSLTDLKTLFGNTFQWDANGYISDRDSNDLPINTTVIYGITESGLQYIPHDGSIPKTFSFASAASLTFTDDVTPV